MRVSFANNLSKASSETVVFEFSDVSVLSFQPHTSRNQLYFTTNFPTLGKLATNFSVVINLQPKPANLAS